MFQEKFVGSNCAQVLSTNIFILLTWNAKDYPTLREIKIVYQQKSLMF